MLYNLITKMKKKLQKLGIILGIMSIFGNNKKHNDKVLKEFRNRIMMKILSIIPTSLFITSMQSLNTEMMK